MTSDPDNCASVAFETAPRERLPCRCGNRWPARVRVLSDPGNDLHLDTRYMLIIECGVCGACLPAPIEPRTIEPGAREF